MNNTNIQHLAGRLAGAAVAGALFLGAPLLAVPSLVPVAAADPDTDQDGAEDGWELHHGTDGLDRDTDDDGLPDGAEFFSVKTNPLKPDTDGDGVPDGQEMQQQTDPLKHNGLRPIGKRTPVPEAPAPRSDRDNDGLYDDDETNVYGTNPDAFDTDGDGVGDGSERENGTDPNNWFRH